MALISRGPVYVNVAINGIAIPRSYTQGVLTARSSLGYDLQTAEAEVVVPVLPSSINPSNPDWAVIQISMSASQPGFKGSPSNALRFTGYLIQVEYDLYPKGVRLVCRGYLFRALMTENNLAGGTDLSNGGAGQTDQAQVTQMLAASGLAGVDQNIGGTGLNLGTVATNQFIWSEGMSAINYIQQLDAICLGYRTFEMPSGTILRKQVSTPTTGVHPQFVFTEGADIWKANNVDTIVDIKNRIIVTGFNDGTNTRTFSEQQANPSLPSGLYITQQISNPKIERSKSSDAGAGLSCEDVANWQMGELNKRSIKATFTTPRDDQITPGCVIQVISGRLGGTRNYWVQHTECSVDAQGQFNQILTCLGSVQSASPIQIGPTADFGVTFSNQEIVLIGGLESKIYEIKCVATPYAPSNPITSYLWSVSGGTALTGNTGPVYIVETTNPLANSISTFLTAPCGIGALTLSVSDVSGLSPSTVFTIVDGSVTESRTVNTSPGGSGPGNITVTKATTFAHNAGTVISGTSSATITLTVTDSAGFSDSITKSMANLIPATVPTKKIFAASTAYADEFDGVEWRFAVQAGLTVVGNGQIWASGHNVYTTSDDLQTSFVASLVFATANVTAIFINPNNLSQVLVGADSGALALSSDGANSWTPIVGPDLSTVLRVAIDSSSPLTYYVLTPIGFYTSLDAGATWTITIAAVGGESFTDLAIGIVRKMISITGGSRFLVDAAGVTQTFPVLSPVVDSILSVVASEVSDIFFCHDENSRTFEHLASGGTTLVLEAPLPPTFFPQPRGLFKDPDLDTVIYAAGGIDGIWKSLDAFGTTGGYYRLREPGVDGDPGDADFAGVSVGTGTVPVTAIGKRVLAGGKYTVGANVNPVVYFTQNILTASPSWVSSSAGLPSSNAGQVVTKIRLDPFNLARAYALLSDDTLWKNDTVFSGGTWTQILAASDIGYATLQDFDVTIAEKIIYVAAGQSTVDGWNPTGFPGPGTPQYQHVIAFSRDSGATWDSTTLVIGPFGSNFIPAVFCVNGVITIAAGQHVPGTFWVCIHEINADGYYYIFKSVNYAFDKSGVPYNFLDMGAATFIQTAPNDSKIRTGTTLRVPFDGNLNDDEVIWYEGDTEEVYRITGPGLRPGGQVLWGSIPEASVPNYSLEHQPNLGDNVFVMASDGSSHLLQSSDRGRTFTQTSNQPFTNTQIFDTPMFIKSDGTVRHYVVSRSGSSPEIWTSEDWIAWTNRVGSLISGVIMETCTVDPSA